MKKLNLLLLICSITFISYGQVPEATTANERINSFETRESLKESSLVRNVEFRNVGPVNMSGRIVDFAVNEKDPTQFYAAYASGGLFYTGNNGITYNSIFDNQIVLSIGDIAVDWENDIIWVGTGENNSSRSSYSGVGLFKSTDKGNSWEYMGLPESHHIGRIILHPKNPNILWVAALGHLYSENEERGLYKTTDGGNSWKKTLYIDKNTGIIDLIMDPANSDILYAASWERDRRAWNFNESGNGSGIYKSIDAGENWTKISGGESGFPDGEGIGRIGLTVFPGDTDILYAFLDNQFHRELKKETSDGLSKDDLRLMSSEEFLSLEDNVIEEFLKENSFPEKYNLRSIKIMISEGKIKPASLAEYIEDENSLLFDTPIIGAELYRSDDGGKTWNKTHEGTLDGLIYTYGYYFGNVRVDPNNSDEVYLMGVPLLLSKDGGSEFKALSSQNMHADHQALWISPKRDGHLIDGNDGGINISYDKGETWYKSNVPAVGQFYSINYDKAEPYNVYGGLQDNGVWYGPSTDNPEDSWFLRGRDNYERIGGGDGMMVEVDWRDNSTIYSGSQFGFYYRYNTKTKDKVRIKPVHELGERPLRFNWETPIFLSRHNQDILYYGANRLYRSMNKGDDLEAISPDLTNGGMKGNVSYGTLTSVYESELKFGLLYTGSDDGAVYVSQNSGDSWTDISIGLPEKMWVSQIFASKHKESRVYVSLNGYRWDHFYPYIFVSEDYGNTWKQIGNNLPLEPLNVVKEDPINENIIYVGTDHGVYVSIDAGNDFMAFSKGLHDAPVHDLAIHPDKSDLILGTHGRSIYIADVSGVQKLPKIKNKTLVLFPPDIQRYSPNWGMQWSNYSEAIEPELIISCYTKSVDELSFTIYTESNEKLNTKTISSSRGLQSFSYDLSISEDLLKKVSKKNEKLKKLGPADNGKIYLTKGNYKIELRKSDEVVMEKLIIE